MNLLRAALSWQYNSLVNFPSWVVVWVISGLEFVPFLVL